jgi:hypothetical protein
MIPIHPDMLVAAWRPFLEPLDLHAHWLWLLPPLVVAIAVVYKALKMPRLHRIWIESAQLSLYILVLMAVAAILLRVLIEVV